jgi:hypothetical protein
MQPSTQDRAEALGTAALALGIGAVPALFVCLLGPPLALAAIVAGTVALVQGRHRPGRAIAGIVLGLVALAGAVILIARPDG